MRAMNMSPEETPNRTLLIPTQRGRKHWNVGGTLQSFATRCARRARSPRAGPPRRDTRPPAARQARGPYDAWVPEKDVDRRPAVPQKPITAAALTLLELYYRLNAIVMARSRNCISLSFEGSPATLGLGLSTAGEAVGGFTVNWYHFGIISLHARRT